MAPETAVTATTNNEWRVQCSAVPCCHCGAPAKTLAVLGGKRQCDHRCCGPINSVGQLINPLRAQPTRSARKSARYETCWRRNVFQEWWQVCDQLKNNSTKVSLQIKVCALHKVAINGTIQKCPPLSNIKIQHSAKARQTHWRCLDLANWPRPLCAAAFQLDF